MPEKDTRLRGLEGTEDLPGLGLLVVGRFNTPSVFPGRLLRGLVPSLSPFGLPGLFPSLPFTGLLALGLIIFPSLGLTGRGLLALGLSALGLIGLGLSVLREEGLGLNGLGLPCLPPFVPVRFPLVRTTLGLPVRL